MSNENKQTGEQLTSFIEWWTSDVKPAHQTAARDMLRKDIEVGMVNDRIAGALAAWEEAHKRQAAAEARATQQATTGDERAGIVNGLSRTQCNAIEYFVMQMRGVDSAAYVDMFDAFRDYINSLVGPVASEATTPSPVAGSAGQAPQLSVTGKPTEKGIYAWIVEGSAALVHVHKRPTDHSPGNVLNGSLIRNCTFYDGCAIEDWTGGTWYGPLKHPAASTAPSLATDAGAVTNEWIAEIACDTLEMDYDRVPARVFAFARALLAAHPEQRMSDAARDVLAERARQVSAEGFTIEQDDRYEDGSLCLAAVCYARYYHESDAQRVPHDWPRTWESSWWKPTTPRRNLVKAAALILAEIERIDRADRKAEIERQGGEA